MTVYVIVLNWNGWKDTIECLDSLFRSEGASFVAVVCDNASSDESVAKLSDWAASNLVPSQFQLLTRSEAEADIRLNDNCRFVLIENGANLGFAGGNNVGVRLAMNQAGSEFVWLLNNDTVVDAHALANAVKRMRQDSRIGLCGSTLVYYHHRDTVQSLGGAVYSRWTGRARHLGAFSLLSEVPAEPGGVEGRMSYVIGAAMMVRREFIDIVGLMQDDYFLYYEEIDWAIRGAKQFRLGYAPDSIVYHKEGASIGTSANGGSVLSVYYLFRNRLRFTARYFPLYSPTVFMYAIWDIFKMVVKGQIWQALAAIKGVLMLKPLVFIGRKS